MQLVEPIQDIVQTARQDITHLVLGQHHVQGVQQENIAQQDHQVVRHVQQEHIVQQEHQVVQAVLEILILVLEHLVVHLAVLEK